MHDEESKALHMQITLGIFNKEISWSACSGVGQFRFSVITLLVATNENFLHKSAHQRVD